MEPVISAEWFDRSATTIAPELIGCTLVRQLPEGRQLLEFVGWIEQSETQPF